MTTVTVTIGGEARELDLTAALEAARLRRELLAQWIDPDAPRQLTVAGVVVATIGAGSARYPTDLRLVEATQDGRNVVTDSDGNRWTVDRSTVVRNRQARIVGWADVKPATNVPNNARIR